MPSAAVHQERRSNVIVEMAVNLDGFESSLVWDAVARESCPEKFDSDTVPLLDSSPELIRNFVGELFCYSCRRWVAF